MREVSRKMLKVLLVALLLEFVSSKESYGKQEE